MPCDRCSNRLRQILKPVSSIIEKTVKKKNGICSLLLLAACCMSGCNGDTTSSMRGQEDRHAAATNVTGGAINSEGEKLFRLRCGACHSVEPGQPSVVGPPLAGVFGRAAGSVDGFAYSRAMQAYGKIWTAENMDEFLEKPAELVPGNRMAFVGLSNARQRQLIVEYLEIFK